MFSNPQQNEILLQETISSPSSVVLPSSPAIAITSIGTNCNNNSAVTSVTTTILALDGLNCGGIPTRTTPTLTPTTLRNIATDLANLTPAPSEDFAAAAVSDLHHLVSSSSSSGVADRLNSDLQDHHNLQNLGNQHLNLQNLNSQHITLTNLQNHHHLNQNSLTQQQHNDYNNSFSSATSRQACFVPPLVLQINSSNTNVQQSSGTTVLLNNTSSIFSTKDPPVLASSSHWQGAVVTQRPQRGALKQQFSDDEDGDEDYDSEGDGGSSSSDTASGKMGRKQNTKNNISSSKTRIKSEFKNTAKASNNIGSGRRTNSKDNKMMSAEEQQRRQIRRERNKLAAARCRKRRMDHTNELLEETEQLEDKRTKLQDKIQNLLRQKNNLEHMLNHHDCSANMNNGSLSNQGNTVLDSNEMSESVTTVLSNNLSATKRNNLQENMISNVKTENNSNILIKCEDSVIQSDDENKDNTDIIPTTVLHQSPRRRPTSLLQLNSGNFGNNKKISVNSVKVLNFDSLMDGGTGLTPVSTGGSVQSHQQIQRSGVNTSNDSILS